QREAKEAELGKTQQNLQQMSQTAQKDLLDRQDAAYAPIEKRLNDAITRAAKANGWDFIFDSATNGLIYKAGPDATAAVKKELGI
ncbi:MAG: OmpH family outer membrane protein, partial [Cloacibacterium sp.]